MDKLQIISIKLPEALLEEIDAIARELNIPRSEVVRKAIIKYIEDYHKKKIIGSDPRIKIVRVEV